MPLEVWTEKLSIPAFGGEKLRVLLFGSAGMLGQAVQKQLMKEEGIDLFCAARKGAEFSFDFTEDKSVEKCFAKIRPEVVINAAALVSLQQCEDDPSLAYRINARFCSVLAESCRQYGSYLVQVSTDHYYAGDVRRKHRESDPVWLINEYARTKYAGECLALAYSKCVVLRTNIVGFRGRKEMPTFLEWAIGVMQRNEEITAFTDFYTSSIHVGQFAKVLVDILRLRPYGIYNLSSSEVLSKAEFLQRLSQCLFQKPLEAKTGSVHDMQGTRRANSLGLDTTKIESLLGYSMPGVAEVMESIGREYAERRSVDEIPYRDKDR